MNIYQKPFRTEYYLMNGRFIKTGWNSW